MLIRFFFLYFLIFPLFGCAFFKNTPPPDVISVSNQNRLPSLKIKVKRDYVFSLTNFRKTQNKNSATRLGKTKAVSLREPLSFQEKQFVKNFITKNLFIKSSTDSVGQLSVDYSLRINGHCSFWFPVAGASTFFIAPLLGLPLNKACAVIEMSATFFDKKGQKIKSYNITKHREHYLGFWYKDVQINAFDNSLRSMLIQEALIDFIKQTEKDSSLLTAKLKQTMKKKTKKIPQDFY